MTESEFCGHLVLVRCVDFEIGRLDEHNEYVNNVTPPDKIYMMELSEGWTVLCKILGKSIPDEPFPGGNDAEAVEGPAGQIMLEAGFGWVAISGVVGVMRYTA
jgi:Sulfotransferase domain